MRKNKKMTVKKMFDDLNVFKDIFGMSDATFNSIFGKDSVADFNNDTCCCCHDFCDDEVELEVPECSCDDECKCENGCKCEEKEGDLFTMIKANPEKYILKNDLDRYGKGDKEVVAMFYEIYGSNFFMQGLDKDYYTVTPNGYLRTFNDIKLNTYTDKQVLFATDVFQAYRRNLDKFYNDETKEDKNCEINDEYRKVYLNRSERVIHTDIVSDEVTEMLKNFYYGVPNSDVIKFDKKDCYYFIDFLTYSVFASSNKHAFNPEKIVEASKLLEWSKECNNIHNVTKRDIDVNMIGELESYSKDHESAKFNDTFEMIKKNPSKYVIKIDNTDRLTRMVLRYVFDNSELFEIFDNLMVGDIIYKVYNHLFFGPHYNEPRKRYCVTSTELIEDYKTYHGKPQFDGIDKYLAKDYFVDNDFYGIAAEKFFNCNGANIQTDVMSEDAQKVLKAIFYGAKNFDGFDFSQKDRVYSVLFNFKNNEAYWKIYTLSPDDNICGSPIVKTSELLKHISPIVKTYGKEEEDELREMEDEISVTDAEEVPHVDTEKYAKSVEGVLDAAKELYHRKNHDYSINGKSGFDKAWDRMGKQSLWLRLNDKFSRVESLLFAKDEQMVQDEKLEDTLIDIINYCAMGISKIENEKK